MTVDRVVDALNELKAALDVEPSAEFVSGVRRRVSGVSHQRAWLLEARVGAVAVVLVAIVGGSLLWPRRSDDAGPSPGLAVILTPSAAPLGAPARSVPPVRIAQPVDASRREPNVLIPPGEIAAMRAMLQAIQRGDFEVAPEMPSELDVEGRVKPLEIPLVVIEPVTTPKIGEEKGIGS